MDTAERLLSDLVAIDSVNPSLVPGAAGEAAVARRLVAEFEAIGLTVDVQEVAPGRPNVVATLEGRRPGPSLMLCGHIDTVGVSGMAAPFDPVVTGGRLYGRGSQDMKSGVAAMIDAVRAVAQGGGLDAGSVIVACVVDEEHSSIGADALVTRWRADAGVVTEPTDLDIAVCHKGFAWAEVATTGRAAHGSRPADGVDAIVHMGRVLAALGELDRRLQAGARHPRLGPASLHASTISGGRELSSYPDRCTLQVERRTLPGEPLAQLDDELRDILARLSAEDATFSAEARPLFARPPYAIDPAHPLPGLLGRAAGDAGCRAATIGMSFWTDAAVLGQAGIPSVLFGPTGAGLHGVEEWVDLASVRQCRDALASLIRAWCAGGQA
ncbi:MAG: M20/M25/M40 family metallo-hydrolase [Vicinamibacterales bacterium]